MDIRKLNAFIVLAETLNYHKAADKLCVTQPALTKQINSLEERLNCILFYRGPDGTHLTSIGQSVYAEAKILMNHVNKFRRNTAELSTVKYNEFKIGAFSFDSHHNYVFKQFTDLFPDVPLVLLNGMLPNELAYQLTQGLLNLAIMPYPIPKELSSRRLFSDSLVIVERKNTDRTTGFSLGSINKLGWRETQELESYAINGNINIYAVYDRLTMKPVVTTNNIMTVLELVIRKDAFSFVPKSVISDVSNKYLELMDIKETDMSVDIGLVWEPNFTNEITRSVIDIFLGSKVASVC
ncbi:LysR family transcriptional regulator [Yersinia bercovieri]|uniref:LysR family transcriptional regulator n=2 Tax=Yersinia bercovieri TaxID=634 RepID=UPI001CFCE6C1|nr:LysR family transcriptional regulator [Yersinia bercovieri]MCB5304103.1 LysR family transcriptional regulator [Yersinia bercovieri]